MIDPDTHSGALHRDLLPPEPKGPAPRWPWLIVAALLIAWAAVMLDRAGVPA